MPGGLPVVPTVKRVVFELVPPGWALLPGMIGMTVAVYPEAGHAILVEVAVLASCAAAVDVVASNVVVARIITESYRVA